MAEAINNNSMKISHFNFLIILLLLPLLCINQTTFSTKIDVKLADLGNCVRQTSDGGYIITGFCNYDFFSTKDICLVRTDEYGDKLWSQIWGDYDHDYGNCVQETFDGGFVIAGTTKSGVNWEDAFIIKTNVNGDTLWMKTHGYKYSTDYGNYIIQTPDSGFILVGTAASKAFLKKYDNLGNELWLKEYSDFDVFNAAQIIDSNNIIVVGVSELPSCPDCTTIDLVKLNEFGDSIWIKRFGVEDSNAYSASKILQTYDEGFIVAGGVTYPDENWKSFILKADFNGNFIWNKTYDYEYGEIAKSIVQQNDSGYVYISTPYSSSEMILVKIDNEGNIIWDKGYSYNASITSGYNLAKTFDNHLVAVGSINGQGFHDIFLIKTDNNGIIANILNPDILLNDGRLKLYPNPFTTSTTIEYELKEPSLVQVSIYNAIGEVVYQIEDRLMPQGIHTVTWSPGPLPPGLYYAVLRSAEGVSVVKMVKQ